MNYEIFTIETFIGPEEHVRIINYDGSETTFPTDVENPRYQQFLLDLEQEAN